MKSIQKELKSFALKLRREIIRREKVFESKSEKFKESLSGNRYDGTTGVLNELFNHVSIACDELIIEIPLLK